MPSRVVHVLAPLLTLAGALGIGARAAGAQTDIHRGGARYDRVADSTLWVVGFTDHVLLHGAGEHPACATRLTVLFDDLLIDYPRGSAQQVRQRMALPTPPAFRLLVDSAGTLTRIVIPGRAVEGRFNGYLAALWQYPVPDSLAARVRNASMLEGADDRDHRFRWSADKLRNAPPVCAAPAAGTASAPGAPAVPPHTP